MYSWMRMCGGMAKSISVKTLVLLLSLSMIMTNVAGGTLAWIYDESDEVRNTFTLGQIDIDLTETDNGLDDDENRNTNLYEMAPGAQIDKDPVVTLRAGSEDCWVFVKIEESDNFADFMEYAVADGWTALEGVSGVYYRAENESDADAVFPVLRDNTVAVKDTVTGDMLRQLSPSDYPTLTFTAYAVQRDAEIEEISTPERAWQIARSESHPAVL